MKVEERVKIVALCTALSWWPRLLEELFVVER